MANDELNLGVFDGFTRSSCELDGDSLVGVSNNPAAGASHKDVLADRRTLIELQGGARASREASDEIIRT